MMTTTTEKFSESMSYFADDSSAKELRVFLSSPADYDEQEMQVVVSGETLTFNFYCAGEVTASMTKTFDELFEEASSGRG